MRKLESSDDSDMIEAVALSLVGRATLLRKRMKPISRRWTEEHLVIMIVLRISFTTLTVLSFTAGLLGRMRRQQKLLKIKTVEQLY